MQRTTRAALACLICLSGGATSAFAQTTAIVHVDGDAAPGGDGLTWQTAFDDLQAGIDDAESRLASSTTFTDAEVWVATDTDPYLPTLDANGTAPPDPRDRTFRVPRSISIRGGFVGIGFPGDPTNGESNVGQRVAGNSRGTVLSGDIASTPGIPIDDVYTVVTVLPNIDDPNTLTIIDNLEIHRGNADGSGSMIGFDERSNGGGLYIVGRPTEVRLVRIFNCNALDYGGGAFFRGDGLDTEGLGLTRCTFDTNTAGAGGGLALHAIGNFDLPAPFNERTRVIGCQFVRNGALRRAEGSGSGFAGDGGAVWVGLRDAFVDFANCVIAGNVANNEGSAIFFGSETGQIPPGPVDLLHCTVTSNRILNPPGGTAGGEYAIFYEVSASITDTIRASIVYGNQDAAGVSKEIGPPTVVGTSALDISTSDVEGGAPGVGNINADGPVRALW